MGGGGGGGSFISFRQVAWNKSNGASMQFAWDQIFESLTRGKVLRERKWIILYYTAFKAADSTTQLY